MPKPAFIKLTYLREGGALYIPLAGITGFGNHFGDINKKESWISFAEGPAKKRVETGMEFDCDCIAVRETPEEIMALIDKAQALVHALDV